jgi:hypothetical protein
MSDKQRFLYGLVGAASPEVIRWFKLAPHFQATDFPSSWPLYVIITSVFIIFGGIFATLWQDDNRIKCFYFRGHVPDFLLGNVGKSTKIARINAETFHFQSGIRRQFVQQMLLHMSY